MRLLIPCMQCLQELGAQMGHPNDECARVEICDDGKYEVTCTRGHKATVILQQQKFEILFEIGAHAIIDGYYREAVSSFAASLERFYEFSIKAFLLNSSGSDALFKTCWKSVSNQSERQLGAFIFLWASNFASQPFLLKEKCVAFRNSVIHKGKIPTKNEAIAFGDSVLEVVRQNMLTLRKNFPDIIHEIVRFHLQDLRSKLPESSLPMTMFVPTIVNLSVPEASHHQADLRHHLENLLKWKVMTNDIRA